MSVWGALVALSPPTDENGLKSLQMSDTEETEAHHGAVHSVQNNENKESTSVVVFLHKPRVVFGRNKNSTVVLTGNPCLSSTHCDLSAARRVSHSDGDDKDSDMPVVSFADHSSNGCRLNGKMIGKGSIAGPLRSGDVLEFVNAGQGSNTRHNLAFRFYHIQHYEELQQKPPVLLPFAGTETHAADSSPTNKREVIHNEVCNVSVDKAPTVDHLIPWALARRMHRHSVDEFYELRRDNPLGHGAFSVVYAATLRPSVALTIISSTAANEVITCPPPPPLPLPLPPPPLLQPSALVPCAQNSGGAVCVHGAGDTEESVLWFLEQRPPCSVVNAAASALRQHRLNCNDRTEAGAVYNFAVKIIEKQRMVFPVQAGAHAQGGNDITYENKECLEKNSKGTNEATLQRLVALETQRDEMEWECAQAIHVRSNHNNKSENLESRQIAKREEKEEAEEWTKKKKMEVIDAQQRKSNRAMRARLREDLLIALTPHTRRRYERELQQRTRHRREIDILFEVDHPAITRLHEVFDGERQLAFVMERATGGDIFGLLERYGPLPEFVVKVIIVQVLEAVQYLHRMGIIHRDLKLENLLLRVPFEVESFCQVQRGVMMQQLAQYHAALSSSSSSSSSSSTSSSLLLSSLFTWLGTTEPREQRVPNPLSPLYTVHVNRALWPAVQISDFGLSCMLRGPCTDTGEGDDSLLYTRHDMTTICGTPIYVAPEVVIPSLRPPQRGGYSAAVDLFSVGVIAFALLTGCAPFSPRPHPNYDTHFVNNQQQQQQQQKQKQKQKQQHLDYTAPLCWERRRERKRGAAANTQSPIATTTATGANTTTCGGDSDASAHCNRSDRDGLFPSIAHKTEVRLWGDAPAIKDAARQTLRALQVAEEGSLLREDVMSRATALLPAVSPLAQELIAALLSPNPRERPTAADALAHPWFSDCRQVAEAQR